MTLTVRHRQTVLPMLALLAALAGVTAIVASFASDARAATNHGQLVPEAVRRDVPVVLDGEVRAHAQVGDRIFVGGDFQQVELIDGSVIDQAHIFAYDINTGEVDQNFRPLLNNNVTALETNAAGDGLYVGGRFVRWEVDGVATFPGRVAKLDAAGAIDRGFRAGASAVVLDIAQVGNDLYIGGDFRIVGNQAIEGIARLDAGTGAVDAGFDLALGDSIVGTQLVRRLVAHPNGNELFVLHYTNEVLGELREAVFKLDISSPTPVLSGWTVPWSAQSERGVCWGVLRDMAISPDGSFIVIGGQGADRPPNCDSVLRYETAGDDVVQFTWSARMYSSVFSLAVSDVAVYVGGHFCAAPRLGAVYEGGLTSDSLQTANICFVNEPDHVSNPSQRDPVNAVFRKQVAALDPTTAQALEWDPGSDNGLGVFDLTVIDRGVLAGHDGTRFNNSLVGASGFFDFGVPDDVEAPVLTVNTPVAGLITDSLTSISGTVTDNRGIGSIQLRLRNITTGLWLQADGSFGADQVDLELTTIDTEIGEVAWSFPVSDLPPGDYEVRGFASDTSATGSGPLEHPFTVPGAAQCTVSLNATDQPVISYSGFLDNGESTVFVRRNGGFLSGTPAGTDTFTDTDAAPGDYGYEIRWRPGGVLTDVACTPASITVPEIGVTCTTGLNVDGDPVLSWTDLGLNSYVVREANLGFVTSVSGANEFVDADRAPGDYNYSIRFRVAGTVNDVDCSPITVPDLDPGPAVNVCTAAVDADGIVTVNWSEIAGEDSYVVRDDDGFVSVVNNGLSFVDNGAESGSRTYVIRSRAAGVTTNVVCNSIIVP